MCLAFDAREIARGLKDKEKEISTVWVVWDPLYEKVISVHKTEKGADKRCEKLNKKENRYQENTYWYENAEFELED